MNKKIIQKVRREQSVETRKTITYHFKNVMSKPPGCRACGNPAYPACKISCPMFDD